MPTADNNLIMRRDVFAWIALAVGAALAVPLLAMQFTNEVAWNFADFLVMGALLFAAASLFVLLARRVRPRYRLAVGGLIAVALCYLWAELAVGVFTHWGS